MSRSRVVAAVVIATLATTTPALAATKRKPKPPPPICNLIKDPAGDAGLMGNAGGANTYDPSVDIVSVDIGVTATMLTAVIRVKDLVQDTQFGKSGRTWNISMSNGTSTMSLAAFVSPAGGEKFSSGNGKIDWNADQVRIHANLADYPNAKIKKGSVLRGFYVTSNMVVGFDPGWPGGFGYAFAPPGDPADKTDPTTAAFTVGAASCVKVGA